MNSFRGITLLTSCAVLATGLALPSQTAPRKPAPVAGKSVRYCNPLPIEATSQDGSAQGVSLGDVTIVKEGADYYMFNTGGGAWLSRDFVNWKYSAVDVRGGRLPVAPHVAKFNGAFYMSGNDAPLYKSANILGPYEVLGPWKDEKGQDLAGVSNGAPWKGSFDVDLFVDDDNKPYLYYPGRSTDGIFVAPLKPTQLNEFAAAPKHLFGFDPTKTWERWGDKNEFSNVAWIEGPWVFKRNGIYYIEHSGSGTQWISYASGVHMGKSPMGPFTYSPRNPFLRKTSGIVTGPGHGSVVKGPDGNWWVFYTIVMQNPPGGRRIGMDPVGFDANGNMYVREVSETPQWAPGVVDNPVRNGDSGSIPLSVNKFRNTGQQGKWSSQKPGHEASYALDDSNGGWWEPAETDTQPQLTIDLGSTTQWDPPHFFTVDSARLEFNTRGGGGGGRGAAATPPAQAPPAGTSKAFKYKIEVSVDGKEYTQVLDKTNNDVTRYTEFDELPPTRCRFVRLTIADWPKAANPLGVMEFTVFGTPIKNGK